MRFGVPLFPLAFGLGLLLALALSTGLAFGVLLLVARIVSAQRLRRALGWVQVLAVTGLATLMQSGSLLQRIPIAWIRDEGSVTPWFVPPVHLAMLVSWPLPGGAAVRPAIAMLGLLLPVALAALVVRGARTLPQRLLAMGNAARTATPRPVPRRPLRDLLLRHGTLRAGYDFAAALMLRERQFLLRVGPALVLPIAMSLGLFLGHSGTGGMLCMAIYMLGANLPVVTHSSRYSDDWPARWIFRVAPLHEPFRFAAGSAVALFLRFVLPALAAGTAMLFLVGGLDVLPDAVLALLAMGCLCLFALRFSEKPMPFTHAPVKGYAGSTGQALLAVLLAGLLGGVQVALHAVPGGIPIAIGIAIVGFLVLVAGVRRRVAQPFDVGMRQWREPS